MKLALSNVFIKLVAPDETDCGKGILRLRNEKDVTAV